MKSRTSSPSLQKIQRQKSQQKVPRKISSNQQQTITDRSKKYSKKQEPTWRRLSPLRYQNNNSRPAKVNKNIGQSTLMDKLYYNTQSCEEEQTLEIEGSLPTWLCGTLYRLGPGLFDLDETFTVNHWFDGAAILFKYKINPEIVRCKSSFLATDAYQKMVKVKRPVFTEFGTRSYPDTTKNAFSRFFNKLIPSELTDNVHGNIYRIGDGYYCASETCNIWKINPETLQAEKKVDLSKVISIHLVSSHPHNHPDGSVYNFGTSFMTGLKYHIVKIDPNQASSNKTGFPPATDLAVIPSSWSTLFAYSHSFSVTKNYAIIVEQPLLINLMKLIAITAKQQPLREAFEWHGEIEKTRFRVINKETGREETAIYYAPSFFFLHTINAFEDGKHIVMDIVCYDDHRMLDKFYLEKLRRNDFDDSIPGPTIRRFVLPIVTDSILKSKHRRQKHDNLNTLEYTTSRAERLDEDEILVIPEYLLDPGFEIPTINTKYDGRDYEFVYGSGLFERNKFQNAIVKFSVKSKLHQTWVGLPTQYAGEALFVPRPGATEEDDGVILSTVSELAEDRDNFLLVLNASSFTEIARIIIDRVPLCPTVHGLFVPDSDTIDEKISYPSLSSLQRDD